MPPVSGFGRPGNCIGRRAALQGQVSRGSYLGISADCVVVRGGRESAEGDSREVVLCRPLSGRFGRRAAGGRAALCGSLGPWAALGGSGAAAGSPRPLPLSAAALRGAPALVRRCCEQRDLPSLLLPPAAGAGHGRRSLRLRSGHTPGTGPLARARGGRGRARAHAGGAGRVGAAERGGNRGELGCPRDEGRLADPDCRQAVAAPGRSPKQPAQPGPSFPTSGGTPAAAAGSTGRPIGPRGPRRHLVGSPVHVWCPRGRWGVRLARACPGARRLGRVDPE